MDEVGPVVLGTTAAGGPKKQESFSMRPPPLSEKDIDARPSMSMMTPSPEFRRDGGGGGSGVDSRLLVSAFAFAAACYWRWW